MSAAFLGGFSVPALLIILALNSVIAGLDNIELNYGNTAIAVLIVRLPSTSVS